jgi:hypothetical protein
VRRKTAQNIPKVTAIDENCTEKEKLEGKQKNDSHCLFN